MEYSLMKISSNNNEMNISTVYDFISKSSNDLINLESKIFELQKIEISYESLFQLIDTNDKGYITISNLYDYLKFNNFATSRKEVKILMKISKKYSYINKQRENKKEEIYLTVEDFIEMFCPKIVDEKLNKSMKIFSESKNFIKNYKYSFSSTIGIEYEHQILEILKLKIMNIRNLCKNIEKIMNMYNFSLAEFFNLICDKKSYHITNNSITKLLEYFYQNDEFSCYYFNGIDSMKNNIYLKSKVFLIFINSIVKIEGCNEEVVSKYDYGNYNSLDNIKISYLDFIKVIDLFIKESDNDYQIEENSNDYDLKTTIINENERNNKNLMDSKNFKYDFKLSDNVGNNSFKFYPVSKLSNSYNIASNERYDYNKYNYVNEINLTNQFTNDIVRKDIQTFSKNVKLYLDKKKDCFIYDFVEYFKNVIKCEREIRDLKINSYDDEVINTEEIFLFFLGKMENFSDYINSVNIYSAFTKIGKIHLESIESIDLLIKRYDSTFKKYLIFRDFHNFISIFKNEDNDRISTRIIGDGVNTNVELNKNNSKYSKSSDYYDKLSMKNPYIFSSKIEDRNINYSSLSNFDNNRKKNFILRYSGDIVKPTKINFLKKDLENDDYYSSNNINHNYEDILSTRKCNNDLKNSIEFYNNGLLPNKALEYIRKIANKSMDVENSLNCFRKRKFHFSKNSENKYYKNDRYKNEVNLINKEIIFNEISNNSLIEFDVKHYFKKITTSDFITPFQVSIHIFLISYLNFYQFIK